MTSFFHSYDLRGIYPDEIDEGKAEKVGKAYGTFTEAQEVLVGRDGRRHGEEVTEAFIKGITSTGTDVVYAGVLPSPVIYFGQVENGFESAAVVTASHNPPKYTGFKFNLKSALAMSREGGMEEIEEIYESEKFKQGQGERDNIELLGDYVDAVRDRLGKMDMKVLINCGNGVTGVIARRLFEELGCEVEIINEEVNGDFPDHLPDPTNSEAQKALKEAMTPEKDLGIIFDGDGDRAGFILPEKGYVGEDEVIALFAQQCLKRKEGTVVYDLRASKLVSEKIEEYGGVPEESRVGHTFISERIYEGGDVSFAGELSGHFYFPAYGFPWDDGLFAGALMVKIASEQDIGQKLEEFPHYPVSPEVNLDCPNEFKEEVMEKVTKHYSDHETSRLDGVKIHFDSGWGLIRPSSTEPKIRLRCEADTEEELEKILGEVEGNVREIIAESI